MAIFMQTVAEMIEYTPENKKRMGIALATLLINFIATLCTFSFTVDTQNNHWKAIIFNFVFSFTGILCPYSVFSMLLPQWLTWHGFAIVCAVLTFIKCYNELQLIGIWFCQKIFDSMMYVIEKLSMLIFGSWSPTDAMVNKMHKLLS